MTGRVAVFTLLPCLLLILLQTGCGSNEAQDRLRDYLQRLARPLDANAGPVETPSPTLPPRAESLQLPIEAGSLDGLDFIRLRGCALQDAVARRNSSLGRVAPPSQRLLLELAFLRDAPDCIEYMRSQENEALAALLEENYQRKRAQLPALIFNATLGNREYRDFWRMRGTLKDYPTQTSSEVISALEQVNADVRRWLAGDFSADGGRFELALSDIAGGDGGELLASLRLQDTALSAGNTLISKRLISGPLCTQALKPAAAPVLRNVVSKYFIGQVQPWSAALNQRYHALLTPVSTLEAMLETVIPQRYGQWLRSRDEQLATALEAPARHVRSLQTLLGTCYAEFRKDRPARSIDDPPGPRNNTDM
jgi:hypothetical protein